MFREQQPLEKKIKYKKRGDNSVSATVAGMIGHQRSFPLTDLDKRKL